MPDYSKGKIYRLECNGLFYYGSTVLSLAQRMNLHSSKRNCSSRILFEIGDEVKIELIENYACSCKRELEERETFWIINNPCVNARKAVRNLEQDKKYRQSWYQKNKDRVKERQEGYRERANELQKIRRQSKKNKDIN